MRAPFHARMATEADNEALLALTRQCPIEGRISLRTDRDPDFFALYRTREDPWFVAVIEDGGGEIVGCGTFSVRDVYVDSKAVTALYASDLKIAPSARGTTALLDLFHFQWKQIRGLGIALGHTSIIEGNRPAQALTKAHASMPALRRVGRIEVCAINMQRTKRPVAHVEVRRASETDIPEIVALLNESNSRFNFAPVWPDGAFERMLRSAPGLSIESFYLAQDVRGVQGVLAAWSQSALQRTRILDYPRSVDVFRYAYNAKARLLGYPRLPAKGEVLEQLSCTHMALRNDDPTVLQALLTEVHNNHNGDYQVMTFGLPEGHRLLEAVDGFSSIHLATIVYALSEPGSLWERRDLTKRPIFHEISHV